MIVVKGLGFGPMADGTWGMYVEAPPELNFTGAAWILVLAQAKKKP